MMLNGAVWYQLQWSRLEWCGFVRGNAGYFVMVRRGVGSARWPEAVRGSAMWCAAVHRQNRSLSMVKPGDVGWCRMAVGLVAVMLGGVTRCMWCGFKVGIVWCGVVSYTEWYGTVTAGAACSEIL